eukprot:GHVN01069762.1.p1 GENE.GHVN01069762.1~~GHVN01069762.1.p1  ORF type:complete len:868 (+),score=127.66 GHVN01069762.1:2266-4869(+)
MDMQYNLMACAKMGGSRRRGKIYDRVTLDQWSHLNRPLDALAMGIRCLREGRDVPRGCRLSVATRLKRICVHLWQSPPLKSFRKDSAPSSSSAETVKSNGRPNFDRCRGKGGAPCVKVEGTTSSQIVCVSDDEQEEYKKSEVPSVKSSTETGVIDEELLEWVRLSGRDSMKKTEARRLVHSHWQHCAPADLRPFIEASSSLHDQFVAVASKNLSTVNVTGRLKRGRVSGPSASLRSKGVRGKRAKVAGGGSPRSLAPCSDVTSRSHSVVSPPIEVSDDEPSSFEEKKETDDCELSGEGRITRRRGDKRRVSPQSSEAVRSKRMNQSEEGLVGDNLKQLDCSETTVVGDAASTVTAIPITIGTDLLIEDFGCREWNVRGPLTKMIPSLSNEVTVVVRQRKVNARPIGRLGSKVPAGNMSHSLFMGFDDRCVRVEQLAIQAYEMDYLSSDHHQRPWATQSGIEGEGKRDTYRTRNSLAWKGRHCEGAVVNELFGLVMVNILFQSGIDDVFYSKYQNAPLDLSTESFRSSRRNTVSARLELIRLCSPHELYCLVKSSAYEFYGREIIGVSWDRDKFGEFFPSGMALAKVTSHTLGPDEHLVNTNGSQSPHQRDGMTMSASHSKSMSHSSHSGVDTPLTGRADRLSRSSEPSGPRSGYSSSPNGSPTTPRYKHNERMRYQQQRKAARRRELLEADSPNPMTPKANTPPNRSGVCTPSSSSTSSRHQLSPRFSTPNVEQSAKKREAAEYAHFAGLVAACIGGAVLARACSLLCSDYRYWVGGQPDLLLLRPGGLMFNSEGVLVRCYGGEAKGLVRFDSTTLHRNDDLRDADHNAKFVEVKGPGDRLSERQVWWLIEIAQAGGIAEVCRVGFD